MSARAGVPRQRSPLADMQPSRLSVASTAGAVVVATISSPSQCAATALQRAERDHGSDGGAEAKPRIYKILVLGILDVLRSAPELGHGRPNRLQTIATFGSHSDVRVGMQRLLFPDRGMGLVHLLFHLFRAKRFPDPAF